MLNWHLIIKLYQEVGLCVSHFPSSGYWGMYLVDVQLDSCLFFKNHSTATGPNKWSRIRLWILALLFWYNFIWRSAHFCFVFLVYYFFFNSTARWLSSPTPHNFFFCWLLTLFLDMLLYLVFLINGISMSSIIIGINLPLWMYPKTNWRYFCSATWLMLLMYLR